MKTVKDTQFETFKKIINSSGAKYILTAITTFIVTVVGGSVVFTSTFSSGYAKLQADVTELLEYKKEDLLVKQQIVDKLASIEKSTDKVESIVNQILLK